MTFRILKIRKEDFGKSNGYRAGRMLLLLATNYFICECLSLKTYQHEKRQNECWYCGDELFASTKIVDRVH